MPSENKRDLNILRHILNYCEEVEESVKIFEYSYEKFESNFIFRNSVSMDLMQIGELSKHLSDDFTEQYKSEIPVKFHGKKFTE